MLTEKEKKVIKKFINGEKDLYLKVNELWEKCKNDQDNDTYRLFLVEYMKDEMNQKEYSKLKVLIQNDSISTVEG